MSTATSAEPQPAGTSKTEASDAAIPESQQLQRMHPDSILADEANPDQVLGHDSSADAAAQRLSTSQGCDQDEDDAAALKRASAASAIFSHDHSNPNSSSSRPPSQSLSTTDHAPNGASAPPEVSTKQDTVSVESLQAQVKDLTNQVTGLNEKLVKSFNRIADLEDDYSDAQERVHSMSAKIKELEKERAEHLDALNTGLLVEKAHVSNEMQRMMDRVIEETAQRGKAESDKSKIEAELDELSSSLFSEANKMVAVERLSRARAEEKSRNMEERLKDTEGIMLEQQKVLADLQRQVEKLQSGSAARKNGDDAASIASIDSEAVSFHRLKTSSLARSISQRTAMQERKHKPAVDLAAEARLIINIVPYQEFRSFIAHLRKTRKQLAPFYNYPLPHHGARESLNGTPTPRTGSPALQQSANTSTSITSAASAYSQGLGTAVSVSSPFAIAGVSRHRDYPTLPANVESMVSLPSQLSLPFIKRSQEEDVEPCLRLDFAPGLNWLSRRQANTAILDGNLVIEPIFSGSKTIDEDLIRRENAQLPPAACAMCGIPVVNVPLPGGVAATALSAEQGGKTSLVPSSLATATSSWASSAASSLGSITGSSSGSNSGTITPKPSRGGLFSSFRKSSTNVKAAAEAEAAANNNTASTASDADAQALAATQGLVLTHLPVPTHIFRLSEGSPTRYLLCPHHCLLRLRAACQYWGFIRNLERSVVLEGKFMNEDQQALGASTSSLDLPKDVAGTLPPKSEQVETLEKAAAAAESDEKADAAEAEEVKAADAEKLKDGETEEDKTEAEKIKESVREESSADTADELAATDACEAEKSDEKDESAGTKEESSDEDKKPAGDDDDFADAPSSPTTEAKPADAEVKEEEKPAKTEDTPADAAGSTDATESDTAVTDAAADPKSTDMERTATASSTSAPPLPPRSVARGAGTGSASPAPQIPPRRHQPAASATPPPPPPRTPVVAAAPPVTAIYLDKLEAMEWEDKMWTEVTKLKEELWRARIGLVTEDGDV
ncbi:related to GTPase activating protein sec2 [Sporisorium reilianum SRZ2]|uniref:Related to GTPase activating protein sec2 n=1 Tax=Sporisorium reilianum (strain SRZ2) TaxID=999809 RepID=E6ZKW3_SPORE|nr:related to GTPase activating protein sec2 [Sporisorium reilianum SRZ2]